MTDDTKINLPIRMMQVARPEVFDAARYSPRVSAILSYLHYGVFGFTLTQETLSVANSCSLVLENDNCTDEAIAEALDFIVNCNEAASNGDHYELSAMSKEAIAGLELDPFAYYLLSIKKMPSSHNLKQFRKHQYLALYILSRIVELGGSGAEDAANQVLLIQIHKLYQSYELLRDKETHTGILPEAEDAFAHDALTRSGKDGFGNRIREAVGVMYKDNAARFSNMSDVNVAKYISENDTFLDYYFHSSTLKEVSRAGQEELNDKGYFSSVLESIQKLRVEM